MAASLSCSVTITRHLSAGHCPPLQPVQCPPWANTMKGRLLGNRKQMPLEPTEGEEWDTGNKVFLTKTLRNTLTHNHKTIGNDLSSLKMRGWQLKLKEESKFWPNQVICASTSPMKLTILILPNLISFATMITTKGVKEAEEYSFLSVASFKVRAGKVDSLKRKNSQLCCCVERHGFILHEIFNWINWKFWKQPT